MGWQELRRTGNDSYRKMRRSAAIKGVGKVSRASAAWFDRPWRVAPQADSLALVHTAYDRNHLVGNRAVDGMTGIELWISCSEHVLRHNSFVRSRTDGLLITGSRPPGEPRPMAVVQGTIAEFNVIRDALTRHLAVQSAEATLLHRNHA